MAAPPITERHKPHFHRRGPLLESVRAATTANITISTALNNGDTLDGVTLATDDRVLVKDQSTGSQNGIYVVGTSPARDYDESTDDPNFGYLVRVREGTANGSTLWQNTNTSAPTIATTALTFTQLAPSTSLSFATPAIVLGTAAAAGAATTVIRSDSTIVAFDATVPVTQALGDSAATGSAAVASRRDHKHGMPSLATPAIVLGSSAAAGSAATVIRSDSTIAAFDATSPTTQSFGDAPVVGTVAFAAHRDHKHGMPAAPATGIGPILITDTPAGVPLVFADLLQNDDGTDLLYADL